MKKFSALFSPLIAASCLQAAANAQGVMDEVYGRGVHAYFAGQTDKAIEWLDKAIAAGSEDPRVYYFHGLALMQQSGGVIDAGISDFEQAANLEITSGRVVNVGKALERIQGATRREIEDIRLRVRLENKDRLPRTPVVPAPATNLDAATDPFDSGMIGGEPEEMTAPPATTTPEPAADPFGTLPADPTTPAAPPAGDDSNPFGDDAPATDSAPADDNPFGAPSTSDNPFG